MNEATNPAMEAARQMAGGFPVVVEGDRFYCSPNFYFTMKNGEVVKGDRRKDAEAK